MQSQLAALQPILDRQQQITALEANLRSLLATDVAWQTMMDRITAELPAGVTFTSFQGQITPPVPVAVVTPPAATHRRVERIDAPRPRRPRPWRRPPPPPTISGPINFAGRRRTTRRSRRGSTRWARCRRSPTVYVNSAQEVPQGVAGAGGITFTATAVGRTGRAEQPSERVREGRGNEDQEHDGRRARRGAHPGVVVDDAPEATRAKASKVREQTAVEQAKLDPLEAQLRQAQQDAAHAATFKAQLESLQEAMPNSPALADFIRNANQISDASGVAWQSVTHGPPTVGTRRRHVDHLGIQVKGTYAQAMDYLAKLGALKRLVVVDGVQLSTAATHGRGDGWRGRR